jgi:hypothetical protein
VQHRGGGVRGCPTFGCSLLDVGVPGAVPDFVALKHGLPQPLEDFETLMRSVPQGTGGTQPLADPRGHRPRISSFSPLGTLRMSVSKLTRTDASLLGGLLALARLLLGSGSASGSGLAAPAPALSRADPRRSAAQLCPLELGSRFGGELWLSRQGAGAGRDDADGRAGQGKLRPVTAGPELRPLIVQAGRQHHVDPGPAPGPKELSWPHRQRAPRRPPRCC